jgi:hypothetical protein
VVVSRAAALRLLGINMAVNHSLHLQKKNKREAGGDEEVVDEGEWEGEDPARQLEARLVGSSQDEKVCSACTRKREAGGRQRE